MPRSISFEDFLEGELSQDPVLKAEWQRLAPARAFAVMLVGYRADHGLNQRQLAARLGVSQPRVVKLESGEHNPDVGTIINAVKKLGVEFCLDIAPAGRKPALVTARARKREAVDHDTVSVLAAAA